MISDIFYFPLPYYRLKIQYNNSGGKKSIKYKKNERKVPPLQTALPVKRYYAGKFGRKVLFFTAATRKS